MNDFSVCIGCGDIPTNDLMENCHMSKIVENTELLQEKIDKGYIKDSCGNWYDPTNYIDCYYSDW